MFPAKVVGIATVADSVDTEGTAIVTALVDVNARTEFVVADSPIVLCVCSSLDHPAESIGWCGRSRGP